MRLLFIAPLAALLLGAFNADDKMLRKASEAIAGSGYRALVDGLASDEMQGREPGSEGERRTVEYIEKEFLELGLQPAAGGDFRQDVALVELVGPLRLHQPRDRAIRDPGALRDTGRTGGEHDGGG
jgi:hypothetical protein